jgi:hypothetical protein
MTDQNRKLVTWGWIATLFLAPAGAIIGIILITKNVLGHGIAQLLLSVAWLTVGIALMSGVLQGVETDDMESQIKTGLASQAAPWDVQDVSCVSASDGNARCIADLETAGEMQAVGVSVTVDDSSGEFVWEADTMPIPSTDADAAGESSDSESFTGEEDVWSQMGYGSAQECADKLNIAIAACY